ncbi:ABC-three component system protein [Dysgonomonas capnocytophagoides]|uniref:ABC-three component system protein n=1 Tax=Dysgonomonas capnocytophagoides TaxID=45254 RepID=UPI00292606ED|nr:hypothetical protein DCPSUM001_29350 [Dysgonomonas capnocytophagoides]
MSIDSIKEYIVIVNGGSGCIFQPIDNTYSYVLTAKHNIVNVNNQITQLTRFKLNNNGWDEIEIPFDHLVENDNYFPHYERDIAIIKIGKIHDLDNIIRIDDIENERIGYLLAGYPETRRNANFSMKENWYRCDENVTILNLSANQLREGQVPNNTSYEEIVGHSGGGMLKISGDYILLAGIQNKMSDAKNEQLGRIEFSPISLFDEIINAHPQYLSALQPPYYKSFVFLKKQIMNLDGCFQRENIEYTRLCLQNVVDEIINSPLTPNIIKNKLNKRMLIHNEEENSFFRKGLWIAWLEFLIILKIIGENPQTEEELEDVFNKYRIIYSSSREDWGNLFKDKMAYSDYKGLKENACIIFANETLPQKTIVKRGMISNIARHIPRKQMKIDEGVNNPFESFTHIHIHAFQKDCVINKEQDYSRFDNSNEEELFQKLKQEYESIIRN